MADELDITADRINLTIDSSIQSIRNQIYNITETSVCIECGNEIDPERSKVIKTNICVPCKEDEENHRRLYATN